MSSDLDSGTAVATQRPPFTRTFGLRLALWYATLFVAGSIAIVFLTYYLTRISLELAARMIFLAKIVPTLEEGREVAQQKLLDGSGYRKFKEVIAAQGGNPQVLDRFDLLPNATGVREISSPRGGYISAIAAEDIGLASSMIGAGRNTKEDTIDPAVGVILEVKVGQKVEAGAVLCRLYYTSETNLEEAAEQVEDAFRISAQPPDERELILEVVS